MNMSRGILPKLDIHIKIISLNKEGDIGWVEKSIHSLNKVELKNRIMEYLESYNEMIIKRISHHEYELKIMI